MRVLVSLQKRPVLRRELIAIATFGVSISSANLPHVRRGEIVSERDH